MKKLIVLGIVLGLAVSVFGQTSGPPSGTPFSDTTFSVKRSGGLASAQWEGYTYRAFCPSDSITSWWGSLTHPWYAGYIKYLYEPSGVGYLLIAPTTTTIYPALTTATANITTGTITTGTITTATITRAKTDMTEGGAIFLNCVNHFTDSLSAGECVQWDTSMVTINDTEGVAAASKKFGLTDTGAYGGASSAGNYDATDRPCIRVYALIKGTSTAPDTFFISGKDSTGGYQRDSLILADGANKTNVSAKKFWEIDTIQVLGAMTGDSLRLRYYINNGVTQGSGTPNNRLAGIVYGRYTSATPAVRTRTGVRQICRVVVHGPALATVNGATTIIRPGTPLENTAAGVLGPDGTVAVGIHAAAALEACNRDAAKIWVLFHRQ
jgi:hypothetical protein